MITVHPHSGVIPVVIYDRKGPGQCKIKLTVIIVSLLYDFMQTHPNLIELCEIGKLFVLKTNSNLINISI